MGWQNSAFYIGNAIIARYQVDLPFTVPASEKKLPISTPLVTQITRPRFLSMGDRSQFALDVHNRTNILQELDLTLDTTGPVRLLEKISRHVIRDIDGRKRA